jgi:LacI family transcriptional regulator
MVTIKDVAARAQVSIATVSRILNKKGKSSDSTEKKVRKAAEELGYTVNLTARSLKTGFTGTIGIVLSEYSLLHFPELLRSATNVLKLNNYNLEVLLKTTLEDYVRLLRGGNLDGMLIENYENDDIAPAQLIKSKGNFVFMGAGTEREDVNLVEIDYFQGGYVATQQMLNLGHTDILFIEDNEELFFSQEIKRGYLFALDENGIQYKESLLARRLGGFQTSREVLGFQTVKKLIKETTFSAILTIDDKLAYGALKAVIESGLKVPRDVSIVGFGNCSSSEFVTPPLTTVETPFSQMGELGAEILVNNILRKDNIVKRVKLKVQLIQRKTLAKKLTSFQN